MDKSDKRRCKHASARPNSTLIAGCRNEDDGEDKTNQWRDRQGSRDPAVCHGRSESAPSSWVDVAHPVLSPRRTRNSSPFSCPRRRQSNPPVDTTSHRCPTERYGLGRHRNAAGASRVKRRVSLVPGETYRVERKNCGASSALGGQFYPGNVAVVRKTRYEDDEVDDDVDLPEDSSNVDDETGKEAADEEGENASDYGDEEQEADDEVDEESDVPERRLDRPTTRRKSRAEPPPRGHRNNVEPSLRHRGLKIGPGKNLESRCCQAAERNEIKVPPTEEGEEEEGEERDICKSAPYPLKKSSWRFRPSRHDSECRNQPRNLFVERYPNSERIDHQPRRPRTTKPEVESSMTSSRVPRDDVTWIRNGRCSHCGVSSGQTPKTTSSRNANCGTQDSRYFTRVPIGDEGEGFKDAEPTISYRTKPRRSNEVRSPKYDPREEARTMDAELGAIYKPRRSKNSRELSGDLVERARHSLRIGNRHEPLKNYHRYWL